MEIKDPELLAKLKDAARFGTIRALGYWARVLTEEILTHKQGELGVARATHVTAMVNVVHGATLPDQPGLFSRHLNAQIRAKLDQLKTTLGPEESRFEDIFGWDRADRAMVREEFRSNFERLVGSQEYAECIVLGLALHVVFDHYLRRTDPSAYEQLGILVIRDLALRHEFAVLYRDIADVVSELEAVESASKAA